ncbi:MAG: endopeptidase La [Methylococcaceae bacterium]|nr:endopeptidase La [Methylococcaceae bacterium]
MSEERNHRDPKPDKNGLADIKLPADVVPVVLVRNLVVFPVVILPITIGRGPSIAAAQYALRREKSLAVLLQKNPDTDSPNLDDVYRIGTITTVLRYLTAPDGTHHIVCQGESRFRVKEFLEGYPFLAARIEMLATDESVTSEVEAFSLELRQRLREMVSMTPDAPPDFAIALEQISSPGTLADLTATFIDIPSQEKQEILETLALKPRLQKVLAALERRLEVLRLTKEISEQTRQAMSESQRKYLLSEQLKTIQKQLGEDDEHSAEIAEMDQAIAKAALPPEVEAHARKELKRLERMSEMSGEYSLVRTYLDWLVELPWSLPERPQMDIAKARGILDGDHYGLEKVKRRILEFLAVRKLKPDGKSPILCFAGPPGVGKTSLGQSIARAIGREFVRVSLGGCHDEAEIRGHRRTYIGALPGNIIQAMRKAGARDCILMLDELDKLGASLQGDPAAALLEVLDPEQNNGFRDNYLGVPFDLSHILFIGTANLIEAVPVPLRDRMEVIELPGYIEEEKLEIARRYLVGRQLDACGLEADRCEITDAALKGLIRSYTSEAGVRQLERCIGALFRRRAMAVAEGDTSHCRIDVDNLAPVLGPPPYENEAALRTGIAGVATGLAWTPSGGEILFVEATRITGGGNLILTGQLGDVMKESAQAALTLVKGKLPALGIPPDEFREDDVHVHVPAGAIPKDGPSAGVAIFVALYSMLSETPVRPDVAMTGEISLRGQVLPVGGIKEKLLAALRAGINTVLLPRRNRKDLEDIPEPARQLLNPIWLDTVDDALVAALRWQQVVTPPLPLDTPEKNPPERVERGG